jgi:endonuclease-3
VLVAGSRLDAIVKRLQEFYGALPSPPTDPFILFVWEVLSVHSTPRKRDAAFAALKKIRALTPDAMWRAPQKKLEEAVGLAGPYLEQRLTNLRTGVGLFRANPRLPSVIRSPLPEARRALKPFPILGDVGAHRMLLFAAEHAVLPVDARLTRTGLRLGYGQVQADFRRTARSIQAAMQPELPATVDAYRRAYVYLSHHGATTCTEADPHCVVCPLKMDCPEGKKRTGEIDD